MAKPLFFDRDLDDPPPPFTPQRGPDPELKTFCLDPLAALELAPCVTIETAESLCLQPTRRPCLPAWASRLRMKWTRHR